VSDAPLESFGEAPLANRLSNLDWVSRAAVAHNAVVERFTPPTPSCRSGVHDRYER
jgi:hypothetical protein